MKLEKVTKETQPQRRGALAIRVLMARGFSSARNGSPDRWDEAFGLVPQ